MFDYLFFTFSKQRLGVNRLYILLFSNKGDPADQWTYLANAKEKRFMECTFDHPSTERRLDGYPYNCSTVPLFELGSLHHDFYLLNLRLPVDDKGTNMHVGHIYDIHLHMIHMNGGFTKVWLSLKTVFFPIILGIMSWFWRRVHILSRTPALLEYMLISLGKNHIIKKKLIKLPLQFRSGNNA